MLTITKKEIAQKVSNVLTDIFWYIDRDGNVISNYVKSEQPMSPEDIEVDENIVKLLSNRDFQVTICAVYLSSDEEGEINEYEINIAHEVDELFNLAEVSKLVKIFTQYVKESHVDVLDIAMYVSLTNSYTAESIMNALTRKLVRPSLGKEQSLDLPLNVSLSDFLYPFINEKEKEKA